MPKAFAQRWTEYERNWGNRPDGFTVYLTKEAHAAHLAKDAEERNKATEVPDEYSKPTGDVHEIEVSESLHQGLNLAAEKDVHFLWFGSRTTFDELKTYVVPSSR